MVDRRRFAFPVNFSWGRVHKIVLISESGFYKPIMRRDNPEAKAFQGWVTGTVLSAIRKDGAHNMGVEKMVSH